MRVRRYLKGGGPSVVRVQTGVVGPGSFAEDGIEPAAGERWTIYTRSRAAPYETGVCEGSHRTATRRPVADPPNFVYVTGGRHELELRSATTGRLVKRVASVGESFTSNGLAISPNGAAAYVTLIGRRSLVIERIAVADGKRSFIAAGEQPAVSPDGRRLAYIADHGRRPKGRRPQVLAVRRLSSGRTLTLDIARLVGGSAELFNGTVAWLGDGSDVVAIPGPVVHEASGASAVGDAACASATCLIVVHVGRRRLTAHRVLLPRAPDAVMKFATDGSRPHSLLLARGLERTTVERVALHGSRANVVPLATLPDDFPVALSPSGARLLYLVGHNPPALWVASLARGRVSHPRRLIADARLDEAAW
jgi:hypothetical protein